jgi:flavin-dependent dehydrogenase
MQVRAPNGARHLLDYRDAAGRPACSLSVARTALDSELLNIARERGVEVREGVRIVGPLAHQGVVRGAVDAGGRELEARIVVGADGLHSVIARAAARPRARAWPRRLGLVLHLAGVDWPEEFGHMLVGRRGYVGVAPLDRDGLVTVGLVQPLTHQPGSAAERFNTALSDYPELACRLAGGEPVDAIQGVGSLARTVRRVAGPGYLLVGDAAGFFDPFTGEGIYRALRGAELAADAADAALQGRDPSAVATAYTRARADAFQVKEQLTYIIQVFVQLPALMNLAVARLQQRPHVARRLGNMLGDLEPSRLDVVWGLLRP